MGLIVGTGGSPIYMPPGGLSASPYGTLFGRPMLPIEQASTVGTVGDILLLDPTQYIMGDKGGMQSASSVHVRFIYDESVYRFTLRTDGQPLWNSALTPAKGSNTLSPFVALATRS
jgi:HK97 family phage major capsid protein